MMAGKLGEPGKSNGIILGVGVGVYGDQGIDLERIFDLGHQSD